MKFRSGLLGVFRRYPRRPNMRKRYHVTLTPADRDRLQQVIKARQSSPRQRTRAAGGGGRPPPPPGGPPAAPALISFLPSSP
jgi:hypothetical protein